ncbi:hypothetical protein QBC47DRAFT_427904 [Echria macrotheca]|uniref:Uncharacterized protein n=1 Tax=Echria macrotheca TaxID=438768 RepID=A0AAJ0BP55_9PEZI|nr:hypothetical protein QBC47DRAFT_427904 [Echria macrotheca]
MSSRLTVPVSKLTRSISTSPSVARASSVSKTVAAATATSTRRRPSKVSSPVNDEASTETTRAAHTSSSTTSPSPHRPSLPTVRTIPLMQGFRTSAPKPAQADRSTIDFAVLPDLFSSSSPETENFYIRVPLLPDNHSPPEGVRLPEAVDLPLARPEISVVAANPDLVLPSALTEVEGMGVDGVELSFAHDLHSTNSTPAREHEAGMLRDIWKGLMDDVFGEEKKPAL